MRHELKTAGIIHIFALLHACVALVCRLAGIDDELFLTILTMAMSLIICMKQGLKIEFTAAVVIIVNIIGFLLGTLGANVLQSFIRSEYAVHAISTLLTTEIIGWCIVAMTNIFGGRSSEKKSLRSSPYLKWLLIIASGIFVMRIIIFILFSKVPFEQSSIFDTIGKVMSNTFATIILICVNIMFIRSLPKRPSPVSKAGTAVLFVSFMLLATVLETFLVGIHDTDIFLLFCISLITQITIYCIVYMINYVITAHNEMQSEREKANMAQYRYLKLKRQVNPHFLFNSLNILDGMVCEGKTEQSSLYIHKLAGIYRYMIRSEEEQVVTLREELDFTVKYVDLLLLRFPQGLDVNFDVPEEAMARYVLPCSIQLLIENATKHNAVSEETPLRISVKVEDESVSVKNNLSPKITSIQSTGLGQTYIRQLYQDLSGKQIKIEKNETDYCVTLPLL
ncbi:MAG: histidine kinase [Bacteroidales bacterium]|nr:histidine kinase [Bacteroidales bacterium]